jgi:hypothetical protein
LSIHDILISSSAIIDYIYEKIVCHFNLNTISVIASLKGYGKPSPLFLHYARKCLTVALSKKNGNRNMQKRRNNEFVIEV